MNTRVQEVERLDAEAFKQVANNDADSAFLARELTQVRAQILQVPHAPLNSFTVFPVQTEIAQGAMTAIQPIYDMVGMAKIIANPSDDLPMADIVAKEESVKVVDVGSAYGYSHQDLQHAVYARKSLSTMKAEASRRAIDTKLNKIAWKGDTAANIKGFIDNVNMSEYTLTADGTGSSTKFSTKTPVQMVRDMSELIETIATNTEYTEMANTVLLAPTAYTKLATTLYTSTDGQTTQTCLEMLKGMYPNITRWLPIGELKNADDTGAKDLAIVGYFDPSTVRFEIPKRFEQLPVQVDNLYYKVPCLASTIGVTVFKPYCFTKAVGV